MKQARITASAAAEYLDSELCKKSLTEYCLKAWPQVMQYVPLQWNWHIGAICEHLQALTELQIDKLIINCPPRTLKSWIVSVFWPTWNWLQNPAYQLFYASYDSSLAERDSDRSRALIKSDWYRKYFHIQWAIAKDAVGYYTNTENGARLATTPEGRATGFDADFVVVDDPHNVREARNLNKLRHVSDWVTQSLSTRGNRPGAYRMLFAGQRISEADIHGYLLAQELGFEHLCLPMEYEPKRFFFTRQEALDAGAVDPIVMTKVQQNSLTARDPRTVEGEILHEGRFSPAYLKQTKALLQATGAAGQLQQRPAPSEGTIFAKSMFRFYEIRFSKKRGKTVFVLHRGDNEFDVVPMDTCLWAQCLDTALTDKEQSSYTAAVTVALTPKSDLIVFDAWREHLQVPYQFATIQELRKGPVIWDKETKRAVRQKDWPKPLTIQAIEPKASGIGLLQQFKMAGSPLVELPTDGDKVLRCGPIAAMYYNEKVFHPLAASWKETFENELLTFPTGAYNDLVDSLAHAGYLMQSHTLIQQFLKWSPVNSRDPLNLDSDQKVLGDEVTFFGVDGDELRIDLTPKL